MSYNPETYDANRRKERYERWKAKRTPEQHLGERMRNTTRAHSITKGQFIWLWERQAGRCAACSSPLDIDTPRAFHVDHDPKCCNFEGDWRNRNKFSRVSCGRCIRGILCAPCNRAVGLLERYSDRVHGWMAYVRTAGRITW